MQHRQKVGTKALDAGPVPVGQLGDGQKDHRVAEQPGVLLQGGQHPAQVVIQRIQTGTHRYGDLTQLLLQQGIGQVGLAREVVGQIAHADAQLRRDGPHGNVVVTLLTEQALGRGKDLLPGRC